MYIGLTTDGSFFITSGSQEALETLVDSIFGCEPSEDTVGDPCSSPSVIRLW